MKIELLQDIELDRQNHLWYGGNVAKISYNDIDFLYQQMVMSEEV